MFTATSILLTVPFQPISVSMVWFSSALVGLATFLLLRLPLQWLEKKPQRSSEYGWDIDDHRRITLRKQSAFFKRWEPWIVGLANATRIYTPWLLDDKILPANSKGLRRLVNTLFIPPSNTYKALASGVGKGAWTVEEYIAATWLSSLAIASAVAFLFESQMISIWFLSLTAVIAWLLYRYQISALLKRATTRRRIIRQLLPHSMDTLAMTMSAGGTFSEAVEDLVRDFPDHPLAMEFSRLLGDVSRGRTMYESLVAMASRIDVVEFDDVLRTMTIAHEHGAPAAEFFRTSASQMRLKHLRQMETAIGKAEAKMPLPTMVIVVACMIIAVAPFAVMSIYSGFLEQFR